MTIEGEEDDDGSKPHLPGFLSATPSQVPSAKSVFPTNFTTAFSPLTNTSMPSSTVRAGLRAREMGVGLEEARLDVLEEGLGLERGVSLSEAKGKD